eukprot:3477842-Rhodomonas_salina.3
MCYASTGHREGETSPCVSEIRTTVTPGSSIRELTTGECIAGAPQKKKSVVRVWILRCGEGFGLKT